MEQPLTLRPRLPIEGVERWDDDGDFDDNAFDDLHIRSASTATSVASSQPAHSHRDSISSRLSARSDVDCNTGDESFEVLLREDESTPTDAIAIAKAKGIPIPANVPKSALEGGTIRRLGGKKIKRAMGDDWSEDLEIPTFDADLKLARRDSRDFPDTLRQISAAFHKIPAKVPDPVQTPDVKTAVGLNTLPRNQAAPVSLEMFRDNDEEDDGFGDVPTIKIAKSRSPQKSIVFISPPTNERAEVEVQNHEEDLVFPPDGHLRLSTRKDNPHTPHQDDDLDLEWAEGSLGTRHGGTRRDGRSNRSSSVSALSPSVSSCLTAESEDDGLDGLILPNGPLQLDEALKRRKEALPPETPPILLNDQPAPKRTTPLPRDDDFADLEIGDGDVFDAGKLTLHRNIKHTTKRPPSPVKRTATTLTFTDTKSQTTITRIPRFQSSLERPRSTLEPVSETGIAFSRFKRPESRLGHSSQSSISSIPAPSAPSTPSRRGLRAPESREALRQEAVTTTSAQLLRSKRSMPVIRRMNSPSKPPAYPRPPSRNDSNSTGSRSHIPARPKTPSDRPESRLDDLRRPPVPFLPAGASTSQSQHISMKPNNPTRHYRHHDSDGSNEGAAAHGRRCVSRSMPRPETPSRASRPSLAAASLRSNLAPAELAAAAKKTMTRPTRRRNFGDGSELEIFDDLPTSATAESRFIKQPVGRGAPKSLRSKLGQSLFAPSTSSLSRTETPMPTTPLSPTKADFTPRFARDTAASRNAREKRHVSSSINPLITHRESTGSRALAPISTNWQSSRFAVPSPGLASPSLRKHLHSIKNKLPQKPQLIKQMNQPNEVREIDGMKYNPTLLRWEGNENALTPFEVAPPPFHPREASPTSPGSRSGLGGAAPALITNVGQAGGVQVVGGMVFDPSQMCWLKMAPSQPSSQPSGLRGGVGSVQLEDEEDVFAGLEDLKEENESQSSVFAGNNNRNVSGDSSKVRGDDGEGGGQSSDEFGVGEEFDVGPDFIRRQRNEEEKWRRKVEKWLRPQSLQHEPGTRTYADGEEKGGWRWAIRDVAFVGAGDQLEQQ